MNSRSSLLRPLWVAAIAAAAGGFAAGFLFALAALGVPSPNPLTLVGYLVLLLYSACVGAVFGMIIGFVPTILLGVTLSKFRSQSPFLYPASWIIAGASVGAIIYQLSPLGLGRDVTNPAWLAIWIVAGAVAMVTYWKFGGRPSGHTPKATGTV